MISIIIISGPWPEGDNIILPKLVYIPHKGDEFSISPNTYKKQYLIIEQIKQLTHQQCRVASVSHVLFCHMQEIRIHLYCGKA